MTRKVQKIIFKNEYFYYSKIIQFIKSQYNIIIYIYVYGTEINQIK